MTVYRKSKRINNNPKLLEPISDHRKVAVYKVNIQESITFLYISNEQAELKIKTHYYLH